MTALRLGAPVYLVRGSDEVLVRDAARDLIHALVGDLDDPLPTTSLVLVSGPGRLPKPLAEAVARCGGEQLDTGSGRKVAAWVDDQLAAAGLHVDREGTARLVEWLGDDAQKLVGVIGTLVGSFGVGARLGAADLETFLGESGGVPPWELTDALDRGDITTALDKLHRMVSGGGRHPLQVMATLHGHYARMLQLDGAPVGGEKDAAQLLGLRGSTFPARKALQQGRRLGHDRVVEAVSLLAGADLDLGGGLVDLRHQARLAAGGLVLVDDALGGRRVDALDGEAQLGVGVVGTALDRSDGGLGTGLELGAHGLVALVAHEVLAVALDLDLDVRHGRDLLLRK